MDRMSWWRESKLGLFIHWGPYARLAGRWQGKHVGYCAEWSRHSARIPSDVYRRMAMEWNPHKMDTDAWAELARAAGMGYVVFTAKHHDGFCMYNSALTSFSLMHAPAKRDAVAELAKSCTRAGLRLGCYYSHRDWDHPDYLPRYEALGRPGPQYRGWYGYRSTDLTGYTAERNILGGPEAPIANADVQDCGCYGCTHNLPLTDEPSAEPRDVRRYLAYLKGQVEELLAYPETSILWFDGQDHAPGAAGTDAFLARIHQLRPEVIVNDRIGKDGYKADFGVHESYVPATGEIRDWESCMSLNDPSWGWDPYQIRWLTPAQIIRAVCDTIGRGGNLLINVGPDDVGFVPAPAVERLQRLGKWMARFGGCIRGTRAAANHALKGAHLLRQGDDLIVLQTQDPGTDLILEGIPLRPGTRVELPGWNSPVCWDMQEDGKVVVHLASLPVVAWENEPALALRLHSAAQK